VILVADQEGQGATESHSTLEPTQDLDGVGLDGHPLATPVTPLTPQQLPIDGGHVGGESGRNPLQHGKHSLPVRLPGGQPSQTKQHGILLRASSYSFPPAAWPAAQGSLTSTR